MNNLLFEQDVILNLDDLFPDEEIIQQTIPISDKQDIFRFNNIFNQPMYEDLPGAIKANIRNAIETIPNITTLNAETLISAFIFKIKYKTLTVENFNDYLRNIKDKKVNHFDLLKYIKFID